MASYIWLLTIIEKMGFTQNVSNNLKTMEKLSNIEFYDSGDWLEGSVIFPEAKEHEFIQNDLDIIIDKSDDDDDEQITLEHEAAFDF